MAQFFEAPRTLKKIKFWPGYWQAFLLCGLAAAFIFLPFQIVDGGFFHYAGDFNSQQISFYRYMNGFVKAGGTYSWQTDLGSGAANAYSFYLYGSPFFWLSLLLPQAWLPYMMCPLLVLKFAVAGGGGYLYARRYLMRSRFAVWAGVLYGLSGFAVYNVFFNHFVDVVALFPYLLWALDEAMYRKRRGAFALLVALNLLNNYFFFVGQVLFLVIYFVCKLVTGDYHLTLPKFARLAVESVLGVGLGCVLAVPAFFSLLENPRTIDPFSGFGFLMYAKVQQYFAILFSVFLPPDSPYLPGIWTEGVIKWTSMSAYLPLLSCVGVVAYWRGRGRDTFKRVLTVCMVFALVPVLNSAFYALNSSYYARWYYMPVLIMAVCSARACEDPSLDLDTPTLQVGLLMLLTLVFAIVPVKETNPEGWSFGVLNNPGIYALTLGFGFIGLLLFYWVNMNWRAAKTYGSRLVMVTLAFAVLFGTVHIGAGKFGQWYNDANLVDQYNAALRLADQMPAGDYRIDTYECHDNLSLWVGKSGLQYFCSTVAPSLLRFYPTLGVKRDVSSKPELSHYALRGLLGVKYLITPADKAAEFEEKADAGWAHAFDAEGFAVYENKNYLPLGVAYRTYVTEEQRDALPKHLRENLYLRALCLSEEQIAQYGDRLTPLEADRLSGMSYDAYAEDIRADRANACDAFAMTSTGFTAHITTNAPALVLFAVPYEDGFTATVNGQPAEVLQVDGGLLAIPCPAGSCDILCSYRAKGIREARYIAVGSGLLLVVYLLVTRRKKPHNGVLLALQQRKTDQ